MKNANLVSRWLKIGAGLMALALPLLWTGCGDEGGAQSATKQVKTGSDFFTVKVGERAVQMQLALTDMEREHGLMGRRDLAEGQGMLFLFERPMQMTFYMRNTPTALDIGYFTADGVLREIYPMYPFDETTVASRRKDLQFALEMNQGWFARQGVAPGVHLDLKALEAAVKARGMKPGAFGVRVEAEATK